MPQLSLEHETAHKYLMKHDNWYNHCWWCRWDDLCQFYRNRYLEEQEEKKRMIITASMDYQAGNWPGEVYTGSTEVTVNFSEEEENVEIEETLAIRGRQKVAERMGMTTASVQISNIQILSRR